MTSSALVVDDHADIRAFVGGVLRRLDFDILEAGNGMDALAILDAVAAPRLVVLDVQMPVLDGWDTLAAIRRSPRTSWVPVILCTVRALPTDAERAWKLGCDGYLRKPFAIDELVAEVGAIGGRTEEQRLAHRRERLAIAQANA